MGKFIVRNGELEGRKFRLEAGAKIVLGRERGDLNFPDKRMSRRHCALEAREDGDYLEDMGSTNGCWVNNERVTEAKLTPGDLIRVGFTELEFLGMPAPVLPPEALAGLVPASGPMATANQTIAFRRVDLSKPPGEGEPPAGAPGGPAVAVPGKPGEPAPSGGTAGLDPSKVAPRGRARDKMKAAKYAAMGKQLHGEKRLVSAKGKFCEACGEAIFMKEGAADEGVVTNGLYLCRMCALIAEKQKDLGADFLPSYAKIVGGRMPEKMPDALAKAIGAVPASAPDAVEDVHIVESEEVSLDDLGAPAAASDTHTPEDAEAQPPVISRPSRDTVPVVPPRHQPAPESEKVTVPDTPPDDTKPEEQTKEGASDKPDEKLVDTGGPPAEKPKPDAPPDADSTAASTDGGNAAPVDAAEPVVPLSDNTETIMPADAERARPDKAVGTDVPPGEERDVAPSKPVADLQSASEEEIEAAVLAAVDAAMADDTPVDAAAGDADQKQAPPPDDETSDAPIDPKAVLAELPDDNEDMPTPPRGNPPVVDRAERASPDVKPEAAEDVSHQKTEKKPGDDADGAPGTT